MTADRPDVEPSGPEPNADRLGPALPPGAGPAFWPNKRPPVGLLSRQRMLSGLSAGAATAGAVALLGVPLGLLWLAVAPDVPAVKAEQGVVAAEPQPEQFIAADGWFALLGLGFGALAAVGAWLVMRRHRGPLGLAAVVVGALGAGLLAWWLGSEISQAEHHRLSDAVAVGEAFHLPPRLRAGGVEQIAGFLPTPHGVLLLPAFSAAVAYTLLAGWSANPSLRPEPSSWDSAAPRTPPASPAPPAAGEAGPVRD